MSEERRQVLGMLAAGRILSPHDIMELKARGIGSANVREISALDVREHRLPDGRRTRLLGRVWTN